MRVIKLTQTREITPYLWVHPDEPSRVHAWRVFCSAQLS
jgi:hypothetical protein